MCAFEVTNRFDSDYRREHLQPKTAVEDYLPLPTDTYKNDLTSESILALKNGRTKDGTMKPQVVDSVGTRIVLKIAYLADTTGFNGLAAISFAPGERASFGKRR